MSGMDVGRNSLSPVSTCYRAPFPFRGRLARVRVSMEKLNEPVQRRLDD